MKRKKLTFGISFPDERILLLAKERAKERGMTLSAYVNQLIRRDLNMPGAFTPYLVSDSPLKAMDQIVGRTLPANKP